MTTDQRHAECTSMLPSAMLATQRTTATTTSIGNQARHQSQSQCHEYHFYHVKYMSMLPSAVPATKRAAATTEPSAPPEPVQRHECYTCHAKCTSTSPSATPATRSGGQCHHVPRLPYKVEVDVTTQNGGPRLSRRVTADVAKPQACHGNSRVKLVSGDKLCVLVSCVWTSCVLVSCVWTSCVRVSCVVISCM